MISDIRFIFRHPGQQPFYETINAHDMRLTHNSYSELMDGLQREGMCVICVRQKGRDITEETYTQLTGEQGVVALYRSTRISPLQYNGFQG